MLEHTFCHIQGIGEKGEQRLWDAGIDSWATALDTPLPLSPTLSDAVRKGAEISLQHFERRNPLYFFHTVPSHHLWRLFPAFRNTIAYLDIETTGLGHSDAITTMVVYDGNAIYPYVQNDNLSQFCTDCRRYQLLVTYNGKTFDLPFIRRYLNLPMRQAHIDLRYVLRGLGYRGGLKACERQLGVNRGELEDIDGYVAVLLWADHTRNNNARALETLLAYNTEDVLNLEVLMVMAYNQLVAQTPFAEAKQLSPPQLPPVPYRIDRETLMRVTRQRRPF